MGNSPTSLDVLKAAKHFNLSTYVKEKDQREIKFGDTLRLGRGGMTAKVNAAVSAANAGVPVVITRYIYIYMIISVTGFV